MEGQTLYEKILELGIEHDHYYSDLYIPVTKETTELLKQFPECKFSIFKCLTDDTPWYDVAFAYDPYFEKKCNSI